MPRFAPVKPAPGARGRESVPARTGVARPAAGYHDFVTSSFRLARVKGIEIGANWTWLLVVALIVWSLAGGVFPETNPGLSDGTYVVMAVVAAVLFFVSLTLHELGHAIQAQREGMRIDGITLWVFGGVARFSGQFPSAGAEFRVAVAGPLVSLVIGAGFLAVALALGLPSEVDGVVFWVGQINLILLVFNLLPALPLDGGRVFRAALWQRGGDFTEATRTAAALGRGFGQLLIGGGLLLVILVGAFGGLWLAFIGWFLLGAAEAELQAATTRDALEGLSVEQLMVADPVTIDGAATVTAFMDDVFLPTRHTAYPVLGDGGTVTGLVSFRQALGVPRDRWHEVRVRDLMTPAEDVRVDVGMPAGEAVERLRDTGPRRLLVCRGDGLVGLLSLTDVTRVLEARGGGARPGPRQPA